MKQNTIEKLLLLEQSGELNLLQRVALYRARKLHPDRVREMASTIRSLTQDTRDLVPETPPGTLSAILGEARTDKARNERHGYGGRLPAWQPIAAAASALAVALLFFVTLNEPDQGLELAGNAAEHDAGLDWDGSHIDTRLNELQLMAYQVEDALSDSESLDDIAGTLLELEGLNI